LSLYPNQKLTRSIRPRTYWTGESIMTRIHAVICNRPIAVPAPSDLPDGTEVFVELVSVTGKIGLDESEWRDDPEALADWTAWLDTKPVHATSRYSDRGHCLQPR